MGMLKGKVALVTGGASGIGAATADRFAAEGAEVVVADIRGVKEGALSGGVLRLKCDVGREGEVGALMEATLKAFGRLDILVNNASIALAKRVTETTEAEWDTLMGVNLKGVFLCSRAAIPLMRRHGGGAIVNVASELGVMGGSDVAAYCASKGGVVQLTRAMAVDHAAEGIRVNCVCPGPVETPLLEDFIRSAADPEEERRAIEESTLLKRLGRVEEIANAILFMASDEASYMTGSIVLVDGGASAW
jgi:NAD(P)-dependent dehydrogenase (short-subunit alcohol dehydrogenase family)